MLLTLMLFVTLLAVASLGWIERVDFQLKRDREEELIHRGVQYSRAIKHFVKKFGRYPSRIEDLENTNNIRFLRRRYKDPITGKDFRLLHMNDVQMSFSPGAASGLAPGAAAAGVAAAQAGAPGALSLNANAPSATGPSSIPGDQPIPGDQLNPGGQPNGQSATADNTGNSNPDQAVQNTSGPSGSSQSASNPTPIGNGPTFGGMPIVGVASTSKEKTIRVFNKKEHYYQWQFIYDPSTDRGGLLMTPNQPMIQGASQINQMNGQQGSNNNQNQNSGFGFGPGGMNQPQQQPQQAPNQQP
jgi:type II secretory pathway pseudopilin PulG